MSLPRLLALMLLLLAPSPGRAAGEQPVLLRSFASADPSLPPFPQGAFSPRQGETIAFLGGTNTYEQHRHPHFELRLHLAWPTHELRVRNLAWQGDTVSYQDRPRYFYTDEGDAQPDSLPDTRERTAPGIVFLEFGKIESLDGPASLPKFLTAYDAILTQLMSRTRRLVLVGPSPFFPSGPAAALAASRNESLQAFVEGIRGLAARHGLLFVDTFTPWRDSPDPAFSLNGIHLTDAGHQAAAEVWAAQLRFPVLPHAASPSALSSLITSIQHKNRLWQRYYQPTNWAFLFGDRQHVPASRDHIDTRRRWFVEEVQSLPALIQEAESGIFRQARSCSPLPPP